LIQANCLWNVQLNFHGLIKLLQKKSRFMRRLNAFCGEGGIDCVDPEWGDLASDKGATKSLLFISIPSVVCEHTLGWK
jgi:hypothetical protein